MVQSAFGNTDVAMELFNISEVPQHIFVEIKGEEPRRETIQPKQTRVFPVNVARQFLAERGRYVVRYEPSPIPKLAGHTEVWMANMTGNPFAPEEIEVERKVHGDWVQIKKPNPIRQPMICRELIAVGQVVQPAKDGEGDESLNFPKVPIEIKPYERRLVPTPFAEVMLTRDGYRNEGWNGQVKLCRAPGGFEPNETWGLDEIRVYAQLMDPRTFMDMTDPSKPGTIRPEAHYVGKPRALEEAKKKLLDALFFFLVDDVFPYPDEREFKLAMAALDAKEKRPNAKTT